MTGRVEGKVALITGGGAGTGAGREIAPDAGVTEF